MATNLGGSSPRQLTQGLKHFVDAFVAPEVHP